jgi:hypothetical protein
MTSQPEEEPYSHSHLDSPEYRKRLLRKLNTLIAVLEVACAKVRRSLASPSPDVARLTRIQNNLEDTLQVCQRAKRALERCEQAGAGKTPAAEGKDVPRLPAPPRREPKEEVRAELSSDEEKRKFERLGPIDLREVRACDLDALCRRLLS